MSRSTTTAPALISRPTPNIPRPAQTAPTQLDPGIGLDVDAAGGVGIHHDRRPANELGIPRERLLAGALGLGDPEALIARWPPWRSALVQGELGVVAVEVDQLVVDDVAKVAIDVAVWPDAATNTGFRASTWIRTSPGRRPGPSRPRPRRGRFDIHDLGLARERGADVVAVAALVQRPLAAIIAQPDVHRPRELEGRTVGVSGLPSDPAVLRAVVEGDGGDYERIRQLTIGFAAVPNLIQKKIDAVPAFWNAEGVILRQRGVPIREFRVDDYGAPAYPEVVLFHKPQDT